jgi:hypothetical protein
MKWCAIPVLLVQVMSGGAKADFTSGNDLWDWCQANDPMKDALRTSYVLGAGETFQVLQVAKQVRFYCIPDKVQNGQAIDVVKLYLRDHPETRQYSAPTLIMLALKEKFPCN